MDISPLKLDYLFIQNIVITYINDFKRARSYQQEVMA